MSSNFGYISNDYLYDELYVSASDLPGYSLFPSDSKPQKVRYLGLLYSAILCGVLLILFIILYSIAPEESEGTPKDPGNLLCDPNYFLFQNTSFCYKFHPETANFSESSRICQEQGAHLSSIHSEAENGFLVGLSRSILQINRSQIDDLKIWIGLTYSDETWHWNDNSSVDYENWMFGEPAYLETDRWVTLSLNIEHERAMQWNNHGGYHENSFVCKKRAYQ